jgi:hypothetical protein
MGGLAAPVLVRYGLLLVVDCMLFKTGLHYQQVNFLAPNSE